MTARRYKARLRIDEAALLSLSEDGRAQLLDADIRRQHPEAVRVTPVTWINDDRGRFLEAGYVYIHYISPTSTSINNVIDITE